MKTTLKLLAPLLLVAACNPKTPFGGAALTITVSADPTIAAKATTLQVTVSGSDSFNVTVPTEAGFATDGKQSLTLRANATSGTVDVSVTALDLPGKTIGTGSGTGQLQAGKTAVTVALTAPPGPQPPDMAVPNAAITPSHVSAGAFVVDAPAVSGVTAIDTSNLTVTVDQTMAYDGGVTQAVDGGAFTGPLANVRFVADGNYAVLSVGAWTVDKELYVTGSRPLVVVASGPVQINRVIHAEGRKGVPGPGGAVPGSSTTGNGGVPAGPQFGGGGGGGHATAGAPGGGQCPSGGPNPFQCNGVPPVPGAASGGGVGGTATQTSMDALIGGGAGGRGFNTCSYGGGAGGGGIQISSSSVITIASTGGVNAGGGSGANGLYPNCTNASGGGGAGGTIFLEARGLVISGGVAANGGAGGYFTFQNNSPPLDPEKDGLLAFDAAQESPFQPYVWIPTSPGGTVNPPTPAGNQFGYPPGAPGGGGAAGVIWFRLPAGVNPVTSSAIALSPTPNVDQTLQ